MTRHRSVLACVAIAVAIGVGLPGLVAATADGGTEPPPTSASTENADRHPCRMARTQATTTTTTTTTSRHDSRRLR